MKRLLLLFVGIASIVNTALATTCPGATALPATPTLPYTNSSMVCGTTNDIDLAGLYDDGFEALYTWTPTLNYSNVTISYSGQSYVGIFIYNGCPTSGGTLVSSATSGFNTSVTTGTFSLTAGVQYYIMFDTWPTPPSPCPGTFTINGTPVITPPPTPTQSAGIPTCSGGTTLDLTGTPGANETWYWQTTATGTSTATPYAGPYSVFANGTYYARTFNSAVSTWSVASSITVSNFPTATTPPSPTAGANPACNNTTLTAPTPPANTTYYWQTIANGTSTANNASTPQAISSTGTYYLSAYESTSQCWSNTSDVTVTISTLVPSAPTTTANNVNVCAGGSSAQLQATAPTVNQTLTVPISTNYVLTPGATPSLTGTINLPIGAVVTSSVLSFNNVTTTGGTWPSDMEVSMSGSATLGIDLLSSVSTTVTNAGPYTHTPTVNNLGGAFTLNLFHNYTFGGNATFGSIALVVNYTMPTTLNWYDAATAGNNIGTGSPFEAVGTPVLPNTTTPGVYNFYAASSFNGCTSTTIPLTVSVTPVLATLVPVNASCNGGDNGSFTLGAVTCGTQPFEYSVNGAPYSPVIPTDLTAGTYTVTIQDANLIVSAPITVVITEPAAPTALTANNVTFYNAELGWTTTGNETSWTVIYGPTGFDPATQGTVLTGQTNPAFLTGVLTADTDYQFYVFSECGPNPDTSAAFAFSTDAEYFTFDNACGPGFIDITSTGTPAGFTTFTPNFYDDQTVNVTLPWPWNINGQTVNTIALNVNGALTFNGGFPGYTPAAPGMFPFNQDLESNDPNAVYYQSIGTAPNRQFVIQWVGMEDYNGSGIPPGNPGTFEIIVDEATNEVYYIYGDVDFGNAGMNNGVQAVIALYTSNGNSTVSNLSATYLTNNSCAHFYNALCPNVTNFTANVQADDAILDWNPGLYGESAWTLVYGLAGFDPTNPAEVINTFNLNSSDASFGNSLTQLTGYDVYIYSECAADNLTSNGFFYNFTTLPFCSNPSGITAATDVDSLEAAWNWVEVAGYPISSFNIQYGPTGFNLYDGTEVVANGTNLADTVFDSDFMGGGVYQVYVQAVCDDLINGGTDTSAFIGPITFVMPLTTDLVCGAEMLDVDGTVYTFNNTGATVSLNESNIAPPATGAQTIDGWANSTLNNTTWYKFIAPASGSVRINATANNYNGQIAVYDVANCADFNTNFDLMGANDNEINGVSLAPNFTVCGLTPGNEYYLMHDGFNATTGVHKIAITEIVLQAGLANPVTDICTESTLDLFTTINGYDNGGVWSAPVAAVNASITNSTFDSEGLAYTTFTFQYRVTDGCAYDSITSQVTVFAPSSAGEDGTLNVCKNEMVDLLSGLTGTVQTGGTWYDPSNVAIGSSLITSANFPGQYNYDYIAGNGVCPNDTANVVVIVSSTCDINSIDESVFAGVSVYPNPSTGIIFVDADLTAGNFDYVVTDANGRVIASATNGIKAASTSTIDLSNVETGVYFIRLSNSSADKMFRIVVQ